MPLTSKSSESIHSFLIRFKYLTREEIANIFKNSGSNNQYDNGLGYGLGWSFPYIGNALRIEALNRSGSNNLFAYGLANGLGVILSYLTSQMQDDIFKRATEDGWFARGLGFGVGGYALQSYTKKSREEVFRRLDDEEFAIGLGEGIGFAFKFFEGEFRQRILKHFIAVNPKTTQKVLELDLVRVSNIYHTTSNWTYTIWLQETITLPWALARVLATYFNTLASMTLYEVIELEKMCLLKGWE